MPFARMSKREAIALILICCGIVFVTSFGMGYLAALLYHGIPL